MIEFDILCTGNQVPPAEVQVNIPKDDNRAAIAANRIARF